jgi:transketolase
MGNTDMDLVQRSQWVWKRTLEVHRSAPETRIASSLSCVEIFVALYYGGILNIYPDNPFDDARDRCVISKGHGSICMYPILADLGYFPPAELDRVCKKGGILGGIPDPVIPGYETINGSLGHGLGVGTGMAFALKKKGSNKQVFVVMGDGELHEGAVWEAVMFAAHHGLDNLNVIVDDNQVSMLGYTRDIVRLDDKTEKFAAFGWQSLAADGHDVLALQSILNGMKASCDGKPKVLVARTLKGRGVPGLENTPLAHITNPSPETLDTLLEG